MKLLVGLGNIGMEYEKTRHNMGFMVADEIVRHYNFPAFQQKNNGLLSAGMLENEKVLLLKPTTFMNLSGQAVQYISHFYKIDSNDIYVFHDELDLPFGKIKIKQGGGAAGHNGLKSIDLHIDTNYHRIRLGIGKPTHAGQMVNWVLGRFSATELEYLEKRNSDIAKNIALLWNKGYSAFLNALSVKE